MSRNYTCMPCSYLTVYFNLLMYFLDTFSDILKLSVQMVAKERVWGTRVWKWRTSAITHLERACQWKHWGRGLSWVFRCQIINFRSQFQVCIEQLIILKMIQRISFWQIFLTNPILFLQKIVNKKSFDPKCLEQANQII